MDEDTSSAPAIFLAVQVNVPESSVTADVIVNEPLSSITYLSPGTNSTPSFFQVILGRGEPSAGQDSVIFTNASSVIWLPTGETTGRPSPIGNLGPGL